MKGLLNLSWLIVGFLQTTDEGNVKGVLIVLTMVVFVKD